MKKTKKNSLVFLCFILVLFYLQSDALSKEGVVLLSPPTTEVVRAIGKTQPVYLDAILPDGDGVHINETDVVPEPVVADAMRWIRRVVSDEYLPDEPKEHLVAYKDVEKAVWHDDHGQEFSRYVGDYLILHHRDERGAIYVQEDGSAISITVKPADAIRITDENIREHLKGAITEYLKFPPEEIGNVRFSVDKQDGVFYGHMTTREQEPKFPDVLLDPENPYTFMWWEKIYFLTDGEVLFFKAFQGDGTPVELRPTPGPPDRF